MNTKNCKYCGKEFLTFRQYAMFCSDPCRLRVSGHNCQYSRIILQAMKENKKMLIHRVDLAVKIEKLGIRRPIFKLIDKSGDYTLDNMTITEHVHKKIVSKNIPHKWEIQEKVKQRNLYHCARCGLTSYAKLDFPCGKK